MGSRHRIPHPATMDSQSTAEDMPNLYRAVLDTVWRLERVGERDYALVIRRRAVVAYGTRWNEGGRRELDRINRDGLRRLARPRHAAGFAIEATIEAH